MVGCCCLVHHCLSAPLRSVRIARFAHRCSPLLRVCAVRNTGALPKVAVRLDEAVSTPSAWCEGDLTGPGGTASALIYGNAAAVLGCRGFFVCVFCCSSLLAGSRDASEARLALVVRESGVSQLAGGWIRRRVACFRFRVLV